MKSCNKNLPVYLLINMLQVHILLLHCKQFYKSRSELIQYNLLLNHKESDKAHPMIHPAKGVM